MADIALSLVCGFFFGVIGSLIGAVIRMRWDSRRG